MEKSSKGIMKHDEICAILPHRPPLLLVDRVLEVIVGETIHATKCVSALDPYFEGHFPDMPVVPGVYLIEGMAQASAILCFKTFEAKGTVFERKCLLTGVEEAKFRRPVVPGDVLNYHVKYERGRSNFVWLSGVVKVDDEIVAEAKFSAMIGSPK